MEDKRYLAIFHEMAVELENNLVEFNRQANGITGKEQLAEIRSKQYEILTEIVNRHKRTIDFILGKPVAPQQHFGEAILLPVFGGGL